jgi:hypothetical protein
MPAADRRSALEDHVQLCRACQAGDIDTVRALLLGSAEVHQLIDAPVAIGDGDDDGWGLAHDPDNPARCPMHYASEHGHASVIYALAEHGASTDTSFNSLFVSVPAPLSAAAEHGHTEAVRALLGCGANPEARQPPLGMSALHIAASRAQVGVVQALLGMGASARPRDRNGLTPFALVAQRLQSLAPRRDPSDLERALVGLGACDPVSHEARMSGIVACPQTRVEELRALAQPWLVTDRITLSVLEVSNPPCQRAWAHPSGTLDLYAWLRK